MNNIRNDRNIMITLFMKNPILIIEQHLEGRGVLSIYLIIREKIQVIKRKILFQI